MNIVLFETASKQKYNAGSKARQDALQIAKECGYQHITLFHNGNPRPVVALEIVRGCFLAILRAGKGDRILVQYPYYPMLLNRILFAALRIGQRAKKYSIAVLIHDLTGLRDVHCEDRSHNARLKDELRMMRGCELIYHNTSMCCACENVYPADSYQILGVFDYLYDGPINPHAYSEKPVIMVAGNLNRSKCGYVYQLPTIQGARFDLFGINYSEMQADNIRYRGAYSPEELIPYLDGQFGLVWDGDRVDTCDSGLGRYLKYNDPHKFSLYLAAGVPVIVWSQSPLAEYVENNKIGIVVTSLRDLKPIFERMDKTQYDEMVTNVMKVRENIIHGQQLKNAGL